MNEKKGIEFWEHKRIHIISNSSKMIRKLAILLLSSWTASSRSASVSMTSQVQPPPYKPVWQLHRRSA